MAAYNQLLGNTLAEASISISFILISGYFFYNWLIEPFYRLARHITYFLRAHEANLVSLEITPPNRVEKSPIATQELMMILQRLVGRYESLSLEVTASYEGGIRYVIHSDAKYIPSIQRHVAAYLPQAQFLVVGPNTQPVQAMTASAHSRVYEIKQLRHYAYSLQVKEELNKGDPVDFILGSMTKLEPREMVTLQIVATPFSSYTANRLHDRLLHDGYAMLDKRPRYFIRRLWPVLAMTLLIIGYTNNGKEMLLWGVVLLLSVLMTSNNRGGKIQLSKAERELYTSSLNKLSQPLFKADVRVMLSVDSSGRLNELSQGLISSFALFSSSFQDLTIRQLYPDWLGQKLGIFKFENRLPSLLTSSANIFSVAELSGIYHFPYGVITTESIVRSHSRTLAAPLAAKSGQFDIVLGCNNHHGVNVSMGLTVLERERHVYIVGGTGNGKTSMLQYAIAQDIRNGKGVGVIDPHGDMAGTLLQYIPKDRLKDVIYFNPDDLSYPVAVNLLELSPGLTGDDLLREKDLVAEAVVSIFCKIFSEDDAGGHRIEYVLRNAIQTALTTENPTLFTIFDLLNDLSYRRKIVLGLEDKNLRNFWKNELGRAGSFQQVKMIAGITAKIGRFLFSASAKRTLEEPRSSIDFDQIINGKILICNLSKGLLGEDTSQLFGAMIMAKLQIAALRRARIDQAARMPFYVYVDEFQNFATPTFVQMLSEARKYKLFLTMAEQSTSQQDDRKMIDVILANVGTVVCFRTGSLADERLLLPLLRPSVAEGEIANLPSYHFYIRVSALKVHEVSSGQTLLLTNPGSKLIAKQAIRYSRRRYARKYVPHEQPHAEEINVINRTQRVPYRRAAV